MLEPKVPHTAFTLLLRYHLAETLQPELADIEDHICAGSRVTQP